MDKKKKLAAEINKELKKLLPNARCILNYSNPWELLVAVILSAQCTDKKVNEVTAKLFKKYPKLDDYVKARQEDFEKDIYSTGFYRAKAKNILAAAKIVKETYGGKVPKTMNEMLTIPGVARKTANVVLGNIYQVVEGIAIDTHMKRLSNVLGLSKESDPNKIEQDLMKLLPPEEWFDFTYRMIEYGRTYCVAKNHDHANCPLTQLTKKYDA
jgi:endonuclease III